MNYSHKLITIYICVTVSSFKYESVDTNNQIDIYIDITSKITFKNTHGAKEVPITLHLIWTEAFDLQSKVLYHNLKAIKRVFGSIDIKVIDKVALTDLYRLRLSRLPVVIVRKTGKYHIFPGNIIDLKEVLSCSD